MAKKNSNGITVETLTHDDATRKNIPTAEYQPVMQKAEQDPVPVTYARGAGGLDEEKGRPMRAARGDLMRKRGSATAISIPNSSGAARISRTGAISSSRPRRSTSRRRSTPRL